MWLYNPLRLWEASASAQCTRTPGARDETGCRCQRARAQGCPLGGRTPGSSETPWARTASVPFPQGRWKVTKEKGNDGLQLFDGGGGLGGGGGNQAFFLPRSFDDRKVACIYV